MTILIEWNMHRSQLAGYVYVCAFIICIVLLLVYPSVKLSDEILCQLYIFLWIQKAKVCPQQFNSIQFKRTVLYVGNCIRAQLGNAGLSDRMKCPVPSMQSAQNAQCNHYCPGKRTNTVLALLHSAQCTTPSELEVAPGATVAVLIKNNEGSKSL